MKTWTEADIYELLRTKPNACRRAVLSLYGFQTMDEQFDGHTKRRNGVGFNSADSRALSWYAVKFMNNKPIDSREWTDVKQRIMKYAGQLTRIANANEQQKAAKSYLPHLGNF